MRTVQAFKAQQLAGKGPVSISILLDQPFPETDGMTPKQRDAAFQADAVRLADALCATLPGGTLDRLLAELMLRHSSSLIVTRRPQENQSCQTA